MLIDEYKIDFVCRMEKIVKDIWGNKIGVPCIIKNENNDCKDYEER